MTDFRQFLKQEKELVWAVLLAGLAMILWLWWFLASAETPHMEVRSGKNWKYEPEFTHEDLAFLQKEASSGDASFRSPFQSASAVVPSAEPVRRKAPVPRPLPEKLQKPAVAVKEQAAMPEVKKNAPVKAVPAKTPSPRVRLEICSARYAFYRQNQDGRAVAIVKLKKPAGGSQVLTFYSGLKIEGLTVLSIAEDRVKIRDARGRKVLLEPGKTVRLAVAVQNDGN